jgi:hypothetical protein
MSFNTKARNISAISRQEHAFFFYKIWVFLVGFLHYASSLKQEFTDKTGV